jgi:hypothetical protein
MSLFPNNKVQGPLKDPQPYYAGSPINFDDAHELAHQVYDWQAGHTNTVGWPYAHMDGPDKVDLALGIMTALASPDHVRMLISIGAATKDSVRSLKAAQGGNDENESQTGVMTKEEVEAELTPQQLKHKANIDAAAEADMDQQWDAIVKSGL